MQINRGSHLPPRKPVSETLVADDNLATAGRPESAAVRLAEEIKRLRKQSGLSDNEVAAKAGYSRQYISMARQVRCRSRC